MPTFQYYKHAFHCVLGIRLEQFKQFDVAGIRKSMFTSFRIGCSWLESSWSTTGLSILSRLGLRIGWIDWKLLHNYPTSDRWACSEPISLFHSFSKEIFGGGRGDMYTFLIHDFSSFHRNNFSNTTNWNDLPKKTNTFRVPLRLRIPVDIGSRPVKKQWESPTDKKIDSQSCRTSRDNRARCNALITRASVSCTTWRWEAISVPIWHTREEFFQSALCSQQNHPPVLSELLLGCRSRMLVSNTSGLNTRTWSSTERIALSAGFAAWSCRGVGIDEHHNTW